MANKGNEENYEYWGYSNCMVKRTKKNKENGPMCAPDYKPFIACSKEKLLYSVQVNWTGKKCIIFCIAACLPGILETFIGKLLQT